MFFSDKNKDKQFHELKSELDKAIVHNPQDPSLYYQRGLLYFNMSDYNDAEIDYRHAVSLGLDYTKIPYYSFGKLESETYSTRDKIILSLFAGLFIFVIIIETLNFLNRIGLWH